MAEENQDAGTDGKQGETPTFDSWIQAQDDATKAMLEGHTSGLKSSLEDERRERKALAKQIVELSKQAETGSTLKAELDKLAANNEKTSRKANFYESAPADVGNLKLAWLAAEDAGLIDKEGSADWKALREQAPELFRKSIAPPAHAGNGAGQNGQGSTDMNSFIRRSAGRTG